MSWEKLFEWWKTPNKKNKKKLKKEKRRHFFLVSSSSSSEEEENVVDVKLQLFFLLRINADTNKPLCISITIILGWTSDQYSSVCPSIRTSEKCLGLSGCLCGQNICVLHYGQFLMICCLASPKTMLTPVVSGRSSEEICVCLSVCFVHSDIWKSLLLFKQFVMHFFGDAFDWKIMFISNLFTRCFCIGRPLFGRFAAFAYFYVGWLRMNLRG